MAAESMARFVTLSRSLHLSARLVGAASKKSAALARWPTGRLCGRACNCLSGPGLAHRAVRLAAAARPHAATSVAHDGGASASLAGGTAASDVAGPAPSGEDILG